MEIVTAQLDVQGLQANSVHKEICSVSLLKRRCVPARGYGVLLVCWLLRFLALRMRYCFVVYDLPPRCGAVSLLPFACVRLFSYLRCSPCLCRLCTLHGGEQMSFPPRSTTDFIRIATIEICPYYEAVPYPILDASHAFPTF